MLTKVISSAFDPLEDAVKDLMALHNKLDWFDTKMQTYGTRTWQHGDGEYVFVLNVGLGNQYKVELLDGKLLIRIINEKSSVEDYLHLYLPKDADPDTVSAETHKGVLFISAKYGNEKSKKVEVKKIEPSQI